MNANAFNTVVFRHTGREERNIHIAVHPFRCEDTIRRMMHKGDYDTLIHDDLVEWKKRLADALWDGIPGLEHLFFSNGCITIQHSGVFSDEEILPAAEAIIRPALEQQLALTQMWVDQPEDLDDYYWARSAQ